MPLLLYFSLSVTGTVRNEEEMKSRIESGLWIVLQFLTKRFQHQCSFLPELEKTEEQGRANPEEKVKSENALLTKDLFPSSLTLSDRKTQSNTGHEVRTLVLGSRVPACSSQAMSPSLAIGARKPTHVDPALPPEWFFASLLTLPHSGPGANSAGK